ncbi:MAG: EamA family transporter [FCB group bacterium]|nr:EamA family transporter [FCB group bacterium]
MAAIVYIFLCIAWGSTWTAIKIGLQDAPPFYAAGIRMLLAGFILLVYNHFAGNRYPEGAAEKWKVAWPGILMYGASYALVYFGNQYVSSSLASILFAVFPFFVIILVSFLVKSEKVTKRALVGMVIGFAGLVIIFNGPISLNTNSIFGGGLIVVATLCSAYATVHIRAYLNDRPIFPMIAMQMILGGSLMLIVAIMVEDFSTFRLTSVTVGSILYLAVIGSILTFSGYYWLLRRIATVKASLIAFVTPIIAIFLGYLILNEQLSRQDYLGSALVLFGVLLANIKK